MAQLTVEQMIQIANQAKKEPVDLGQSSTTIGVDGEQITKKNNQLSVDQMVAMAKQQQRENYKPFDWKATQKEGMTQAAKEAGETQPWESGLLGFSDLAAGAIQGATYVADGISGLSNKLLGTNLDTKSYERFTKERQDTEDWHNLRRDANEQGFDGWRLGGAVAGTAPIALTGGGGLLGVAGKGAVSGGLISQASFAKDSDTRSKNAVAGAIGGAAGGVIGKKIGNGVVRGYNAIKNNMRSGVNEIIEEGEKHGVRSSVGDVGKNAHIARTEHVLERIPLIGIGSFREAQQQEAKTAASKVVEKLQDKLSDTDYKSLLKIQNEAIQGNKNAIRIMDIIKGAEGNLGKTLQASMEIQNWRGQKLASNMFDRVGKQAGNAPIPAPHMLRAIDDVIAADSKTVPNRDLLAKLNEIKNNWANPANPQNFRELKAARSSLGELVGEWGRQGKSTSNLTAIRTAIDNDMENFALNSGKPALINEFKKANAFYKTLKESESKALAKSMSTNTPDEIFKTFVQMGKGDSASNFYKSLDPRGQAALRYEMANRALTKATSTSNDDVFSPAKFAREFERLQEPYQNIFKGTDKAEMDGFVKLMRHVERAGQYSSSPTNGSMVVLPATGLSLASMAINEPLSAAASVSSIYGLSKLFTTSTGRRILLAAKDLPPGSEGLENLLKMAQKLSTTTGSNLNKENP